MRVRIKVVILIALVLNGVSTESVQHHRAKRIVGGNIAAKPPPDDPVVFVRAYNRDARIEGYRHRASGLYSFLGIRFAHPPIGADRFRRPRFKRLEGDINATVYGMPCPQPDSDGYIVGSEDCLWLNVFTPQMPDETTGLPVIVWIHGGGYRYGSANQYTADSLTSKGVIFVPIQYRLGTLGMLGDGTREFSGNAALFDMATALRWVHEYIQYFGGDRKQIIVMGHGSGATAATYLTTTQIQSREMVSGVVAMSGSPYTQNAIDETPAQTSKEIININGCTKSNETEVIECMRKKSFEEIVKKDSSIQVERLQGEKMIRTMNGNVGYQPLIEGADNQRSLPGFLPENPRYVIGNGTFKKVPLLTGVTRDETANAIDIKNIEKSFASATQFLDSVANSMKKSNWGTGIGNVVSKMLPGIEKALSLREYLKVSDKLNVMQVINKLTEATTDALFNLPAIFTAQLWTKIAPAYLYSFEHVGRSSNRGATFLRGLPIVGNSKPSNATVAHGDELAYLFDARDIFGKAIENLKPLDATDGKVRDVFSNLIRQFSYLNSGQSANGKSVLKQFTSDQSNFIKIGQEATLAKDFRYCQMALWGALVKPSSKDTSCKFIANQLASSLLTATGNLTSSISGAIGGLFNAPSKMGAPNNQIGGSQMAKQADKTSSANIRKNENGILGIGIL